MEITKDKITEIFCIIAYPELRLLSIRPAPEGIPYRDQASTLLAEV